jgi:hypothetical protein
MSGPLDAKTHHMSQLPTMPPPDPIESISYKDRVILAVQRMKSDASLSVRHIASVYNVFRATLTRRRVGTHSRRDIYSTQSNLTKSEENSLVLRIRDLSLLGFAPSHSEVRGMANQLLAIRGSSNVGIN